MKCKREGCGYEGHSALEGLKVAKAEIAPDVIDSDADKCIQKIEQILGK